MPDSSPGPETSRLSRAVEAARSACLSGRPPAPAELAGLLARCRALAGDDQALVLGQAVVKMILDLAREQGPAYLAALDREPA